MMQDIGKFKHDADDALECARCEQEIPCGVVAYAISSTAEQIMEDGTIAVLGALARSYCRECAATMTTVTLETPFAELLRTFDADGSE